jgi:hypothetical protein
VIGRFVIAFAAVLGYLAAWALVLLPVTLAVRGDAVAVLVVVGATLVLAGGGIIPYLDFVAKHVFRYKGEGPPVAEAELRALIGRVNDVDVPVTVAERGRKLVLTWRYVDAKWWEVLSKSGLRSVYELDVKLDDRRKLATLIDVQKSVRWSVGPGRVRVWGGFFRGVMLGYSMGAQWGITETFGAGRVFAFTFDPMEIKNPVMNTILRSGWDVRFGLW